MKDKSLRRTITKRGLVESADGWTTVAVVASRSSSTGQTLRKTTTTTKPIRGAVGRKGAGRGAGGGGGEPAKGRRSDIGNEKHDAGNDDIEGRNDGDDDDDVKSLEEVKADYFRCQQAWEQSECWRQLSAMLLGLLLSPPPHHNDDYDDDGSSGGGDSGDSDGLQRRQPPRHQQRRRRRRRRQQQQQQQQPQDGHDLGPAADANGTMSSSSRSNRETGDGPESGAIPCASASSSLKDGSHDLSAAMKPTDHGSLNSGGDCCATATIAADAGADAAAAAAAAMAVKLDTCVCLGLGSLSAGSHRGRQTSLYQLACLQSILRLLRVYRRGGHHHHHLCHHPHHHHYQRHRFSSSQSADTMLREPRSTPSSSSPSPATTVQGCSSCRTCWDGHDSSSSGGDDRGGNDTSSGKSDGDAGEDGDGSSSDGSHSLRVYAQDPLFTKVDVAFLASLGIDAVPPPAAQAFIGTSTFVYAPHCERSFLLPVLVARKARERGADDDGGGGGGGGGGNCDAAASAVEDGSKDDNREDADEGEDGDSPQLVICNDMESVADGVLTLSAPRSEVLAARRFLWSRRHQQQQQQQHHHHHHHYRRHGSSMLSPKSKSDSGSRRRRSLAFPVFTQDEYVFNDLCVYWKEDTQQTGVITMRAA